MAVKADNDVLFQSTLPARGATQLPTDSGDGIRISIHAPREGSDVELATLCGAALISIHAPREGSDG